MYKQRGAAFLLNVLLGLRLSKDVYGWSCCSFERSTSDRMLGGSACALTGLTYHRGATAELTDCA